jgi:hypothetical protein
MNWEDQCGEKLVGIEQAIGTIQSGDVVHVAPYSTSPVTLCKALQERAPCPGPSRISPMRSC